ncbi:type III effector Hrp-dependent outer protein [Coriobacterium glomerans PW2]|uniref:Type III effector Hrp-dependent outer protein n=1 Tax=Coriobacterium glomerans (strain ATCC 49209 / DSM 20642 / JCM 10262 / PW2) TaxID=700015 RepID=F2NA52_CORGP|nr:four-carbon acid sugar kinase family protein [Coriobacterium glomerans]AEB06446.1 type III effector Hrp-dependent outer protein [Coriobacterium glomerans PW2]
MVDILIIADDLTGAIDASAPLIGAGVEILTEYEDDSGAVCANASARVLSINADTRHLGADEARERVGRLVRDALSAGVGIIVKKTDSALRGNVGAELAGALSASGEQAIHFMPAFPGMHRVTREGIQYVDGAPVHESVFADDPFEPVRVSRVAEIVAEGTKTPVTLVQETQAPPEHVEGIIVYDATSDDGLYTRVTGMLHARGALMLAGCAALVAALARALDIPSASTLPRSTDKSTLAFCGSVNAVSVDQCACAREAAAPVKALTAAQILDARWTRTAEFAAFARDVSEMLASAPLAVVDASAHVCAGIADADADAADEADAIAHLRELVSDNLGHVLARLLELTEAENVLVMGGDILLAMLHALHIDCMQPIAELSAGVVVSRLDLPGRSIRVISKSGGFGQRDLFLYVADILSKGSYESCMK